MKKGNYRYERNIDEVNKKTQRYIREFGWVVHFIREDRNFPNSTNYHTHGLLENYHHLDLQICLPINLDLAQSIFNNAVDQIKKGVAFEPNFEYDDILGKGVRVRFIRAIENDQLVLRLCIPDENGGFDAPFYKEQLSINHSS